MANPTTTASSGSSSFSTTDATIVVVGALVLIGGIAFFIWHDARRRAPVSASTPGVAGQGRRAGSKSPQRSRKLSQAERRRRKRGRAR